MERAELLCDVKKNYAKRKSWMLLSILVGVVAPVVAVLPFTFGLEEEGNDPSRDGLIVSSLWLGLVEGYVKILVSFFFVHFHCQYNIFTQSRGCIDSARNESCVCKDSNWSSYDFCIDSVFLSVCLSFNLASSDCHNDSTF